MQLTDKHILVVGLGRTGVALARFLKSRGAAVTITDTAHAADLASRIALLEGLDVRTEFGPHRSATFEAADLILLSPGVPHTLAPLDAARRRGVPVLGEMELAFRFITEPIVAVSGTNGKTTTTLLVGEMLRRSGLRVFVGGNIGDPLIGYVDRGPRADIVVAEVSSFQLDTTRLFRPRVGILLNVTPDHLDRYPDFEAYARSKAALFANQTTADVAVLNGDDPNCRGLAPRIASRTLFFNAASAAEAGATINHRGIRINWGGRPGAADGALAADPRRMDLSLAGLPLRGRHNLENIAAAGLATLAAGGTIEGIRSALGDFRGLPHRLEHVASINDVDYYNDSKATNPDAVQRALEAFDVPIVLIMGGRSKSTRFDVLQGALQRRVKSLVLLGEAAEEIAAALGPACRGNLHHAATMAAAVRQAAALAAAGEVVLLSPACASFDMYTSYALRGEDFAACVEAMRGRSDGC